MEDALYGDSGFFRVQRPGEHFRTSVHAGGAFPAAMIAVLAQVDGALGHPEGLEGKK